MTAEAGALERLEAALARIRARDRVLHLVTARDEDGARRAAEASDRRRAEGRMLGPLDGMLVGVKDNIAVAGLPLTAGVGAWSDRRAEADAPSVARLRAAGAIPFAMLNMHEGALGATSDNPHFGRAANPLDPGRTPGGSSGGSAAAVAAGFVEASLGTDTMGSVRIPAAYCGVAGLKPTRGLVPRSGTVHLSPTLDTVGPIAADVAALTAIIRVLAGHDPGDPESLPAPRGWDPEAGRSHPSGLRIGIPRQIDETACESAVLEGLAEARAVLASRGADVVDIDLAGWHPGPARRGGLLLVEAEGAVEFASLLDAPDSAGISAAFRSLLAYGRDLPSRRLVEGLARMRAAAAAADRAFGEVDLLLMPTAPQLAFPHGAEVPANQADLTALANFHGGPALSVPVPGEGMPVGVQIIGPAFSEGLVLSVGAALERAVSRGRNPASASR
jgi:aspartyl-tRNA(Asn)/glutamyl-tRNA(Gln) amidotransferase subunit A